MLYGLSCGTSEICELFTLFNLTYCCARAYVSPQPLWFISGAMSVLSHVVFFWFHFKKRNEMKKKKEENYKKNQVMKMNKMKAKLK